MASRANEDARGAAAPLPPPVVPRITASPPTPPRRSHSTKTLGQVSALDYAGDEPPPSVLSLNNVVVVGTTMADAQMLLPEPRYPGEDTRPTSSRELWGFYSYGFAAEVFVVCGVGSFIPITLEQLVREVGVLLSDKSTPCTTGLGFNPPPNYNVTASVAPEAGQCIVNIGIGGNDVYVNTASFAMYTFSISVLIQSLVIISMSGAADHGRYRKKFLLGFAIVGSIATMLFIFVTSKVFMIGALLAIISNTCFGASFVLLNSFLPLLVRHHPSIAPIIQDSDSLRDSFSIENEDDPRDSLADIDRQMVDSTTGLLSHQQNGPDKTRPDRASRATAGSPALQLSTRFSSNGIALGYVAAIIVQIVAALIVFFARGSLLSLRFVLLFVGAWWLLFSIPAAMLLRPRPGPPLDHGSNGGKAQTWAAYLAHAWIALGKTVTRARRLKDMLLFLAAWFLLSDGIATVSGTAILFAKTTLGMKPAALAMINVVVMVFGVIGALGWSHVSRFFGLRASQTILACIFVFELIPIYALLGYIPALQKLGFLGLQQPWEIYPLGAFYGLVMGGLSSYCRSLFGELIPPGNEASFYALYAITDKGSSVFGPAIVGAITDATGSIRPAFWFLAVLIGLPFPILWFVDVDRGKREGRKLAMEFDGGKALEGEIGEGGPVVYTRSNDQDGIVEGGSSRGRTSGAVHGVS